MDINSFQIRNVLITLGDEETIRVRRSLTEVLELGFADGSNRYDGNKPFPHPHVICTQCKKIIDPELSSLKDQKARLFSNIAASMQGVPQFIIERQLGHFEKVHPDYAAGVRKALAELAQKAKAAK